MTWGVFYKRYGLSGNSRAIDNDICEYGSSNLNTLCQEAGSEWQQANPHYARAYPGQTPRNIC